VKTPPLSQYLYISLKQSCSEEVLDVGMMLLRDYCAISKINALGCTWISLLEKWADA